MAIPSVTPFASFDKAAGTQGLSIDQKLWGALMAGSPILSMLARPSIDEVKYSWETANAPTRTYVGVDVASNVWDGATNTALKLTGGHNIAVGSILRNATRATPVTSATYLSDELVEVTANDGNTTASTLVIQRNIGVPTGSTLGTGVASSVLT